MEIRSAGPDDLLWAAHIYAYYIRTNIATLEEKEPPIERLEEDFSKMLASGDPFIVAVASGSVQIAGYADVSPFRPRSGFRFSRETSIYIHADYSGKGLGCKLLHEVLVRLTASGNATQVVAQISILPHQTEDEVASCRLHKAFGFKIVGRLQKVGCKFDQWIDVIIIQTDVKSIMAA